MCAALGNESKEFYRFMSILQAQSTEPIPSPGRPHTLSQYLFISR